MLRHYINKHFAKKSIRALINKADYGRLNGKQFHGTFNRPAPSEVIIISKYTAFEKFEGDVFCRPSPQANLTGCESRDNAALKMELFDQVTLHLGNLGRKRPWYWLLRQ